MLIGTVCKDIEVKEVNDKKVVNLVLACNRPFPNVDGTRATDFFNISLWEFLADQAYDYYKLGSKVAVKGRIVPKLVTLESGVKIHINELVGERLMNVTQKADNPDIQEPIKEETSEEN